MKKLTLLAILLSSFSMVYAQHDHSTHEGMKKDTSEMHSMDSAEHNMMMAPHNHSFSLNLPMERNGSGTGWLPDESPMFGIMIMKPKWMHMFHYNLFLRYNNQDLAHEGIRGDEDFDIPSWFMMMGQRKMGGTNLFHYSAMISFDPFLVGEQGYPLLFQTGESYNGQPIVDHQHPHDLFSELSVSLSHAFTPKSDLFVYLGYPGEPALGPIAFMHRTSALDNPNSPLNHHWLDATHITFGVATLGLRVGQLKLESSLFTGREPDENRYDFDKPKFDSWSTRVSLNPSPSWALQVSSGFLKNPELLHPEEDIYRTTASAVYTNSMNDHHTFSSTLAWGLNNTSENLQQHAFLAEAAWKMHQVTVYGRYDYTQKSAAELALEENFVPNELFTVQSITLGLNLDILNEKNVTIAPGINFTIYPTEAKLKYLYGETPLAMQVYLRIYPGSNN